MVVLGNIFVDGQVEGLGAEYFGWLEGGNRGFYQYQFALAQYCRQLGPFLGLSRRQTYISVPCKP
jgi:hypothetical protein